MKPTARRDASSGAFVIPRWKCRYGSKDGLDRSRVRHSLSSSAGCEYVMTRRKCGMTDQRELLTADSTPYTCESRGSKGPHNVEKAPGRVEQQ